VRVIGTWVFACVPRSGLGVRDADCYSGVVARVSRPGYLVSRGCGPARLDAVLGPVGGGGPRSGGIGLRVLFGMWFFG